MWGPVPGDLEDSEDPVVLVTFSDVHLSHRPPVGRSLETDWYLTQARALNLVKELTKKYSCPAVLAGDLFDDGWRPGKCPPELINLALRELPHPLYGVPGQHDLPHHRYEEVGKSAYSTLVQARRLINLAPGEDFWTSVKGLPVCLRGFPWGTEIEPRGCGHDLALEVAVIHSYVWVKGEGRPGAPREKNAKSLKKRLEGYDVALFGDNHRPFSLTKEDYGLSLFNCGTLLRRKRDEKDYPVGVGLVRRSGTVTRHPLRHEEVWEDGSGAGALTQNSPGTSEFVEELLTLSETSVSFREVLLRHMDGAGVSDSVRALVLNSLEDH